MVPELELIIGPQPPAPELSGTAAQNRFNLLLQAFIRIFTRPEHPLVMFLDDLQWADLASLDLIQLLMEEVETGYLLLVGAYRDNEVFAAHPLMLTLDTVGKAGSIINTIILNPLSLESVNCLISDTLKCPVHLTQPLAELTVQKTQGNPFFVTQFLKALHQDGWIEFEPRLGAWRSDITQIRTAALTDEVVDLVANRLKKLPIPTQIVLQLAACIGNQFDLNTLAVISEQTASNTAEVLWEALQEGFILPQSDVYKFYLDDSDLARQAKTIPLNYKFLHDRVQQAAYSLIPEVHRTSIHYRIGRLLLSHFTVATQEERIFQLVGHLNQGNGQIASDSERLELAQLNLLAGRKAMSSTAYAAALEYLNKGIEQLPDEAWCNHYALTLELHHHRLEAAFLNTRFEDLEAWGEIVLQQTTSVLDRIKVYETRIMARRSQGRFLEVVETGLQVLKLLGIEFPDRPTNADVGEAYGKSRQAWEGQTPLNLLNLPAMQDSHLLAAMQIMSKIVPSAHIAAPLLLPLLSFKQIEISIQHGNCPISIFSYADYGLILCGIMGDLSTGYEFGQLSLALLEKLQANSFKSRAYFIVNSFTRHWREPLNQSIPMLLEGYRCGLESGDWECVALNLLVYSHYQYWAGRELTELAAEMVTYRQVIEQIKQEATLVSHEAYLQAVLNLLGEAEIPYRLQGSVFDAEKSIPLLQAANDRVGLFNIYINQALLCYLFEQDIAAVELTLLLDEYSDSTCGFFLAPIHTFYDALIYLRSYPSQQPDRQATILHRIAAHQEKLQNWAVHAACNHQHRWQLVAAEQARVLDRPVDAIEHYDLAIANAKANGYLQEEALANELAARFYLGWGKEKIAAIYMQEAYYCYARWGAKAKINDLKYRHPNLLRSILQSAAQPINVLETLATISAPNLSLHSSNDHSQASTTSINTALDFAAILKASQSLSGTIDLDELLHQITQIILQNSGGDRCALMLPNQSDEWEIVAKATAESIELCSEPLTSQLDLPIRLIQYVKKTQEVVMIDNSNTHLPISDEYLLQQRPKSVLCLPILNQGHLIGILYLQNQSTKGVFTSDRILTLNFLCTQAAISLKNARLFHESNQARINLQQTQLQMVQSEKMSALGNLVAGVAHEINNPVGCIVGNVGAVQAYINDLLGVIDLYAQKFPQPGAEIEAELEAIELDYLREDLPKLIRAMKDGGERIKSISRSLRTFSRADTDSTQAFNLHEGIDSTVLILRHRLKANQYRPEIQVDTDYGNIPNIHCFPGQLNQVFMNIIANAIDALDEVGQGLSYADIQAAPHRIMIRTALEQDYINITIADNGPGMPEAVKERIFDHLFTTKSVGQGTGLGLAIARQIVVDKHNGTIDVLSALDRGSEFLIRLPLKRLPNNN